MKKTSKKPLMSMFENDFFLFEQSCCKFVFMLYLRCKKKSYLLPKKNYMVCQP